MTTPTTPDALRAAIEAERAQLAAAQREAETNPARVDAAVTRAERHAKRLHKLRMQLYRAQRRAA